MNHLSMINRPNTNPANSTDANPTTADCSNCGTKDSLVVHHVRLRGIHRRLCTACVLRLHPGSFCPSCFTVYDSTPPPPSKRLSCNNCSSFTHTTCAPNHPPAPFAFLCPPCADPSFKFMNLHRTRNRAIDQKMATVLLCAAKIAASSMVKAVAVARAEAERRVREAAVCRKRAREALEHVALVAKRKEVESVEVSGSGTLGKRENEGAPKTVFVSTDKLKSNGKVEMGLENGYSAQKKPSLNISRGGITVKEGGVNSLVHSKS